MNRICLDIYDKAVLKFYSLMLKNKMEGHPVTHGVNSKPIISKNTIILLLMCLNKDLDSKIKEITNSYMKIYLLN